MNLTVGSLFSGIGGLDLGLERAGMNVIWQSEIDPYSCRVLKKHWPEVPNHGDIKEINWQEIARPDVICGGYPCQPFSQAGKRRGEEDPRHLWPWVREAISELRPRYAILENVRGHLSMGGLSVIGELAAVGYDAEWRVVSAASVGANHRRDRIIIVAYPTSERLETTRSELKAARTSRNGEDERQSVADTNDAGGRTSRSRVNGYGTTQEQGWDDQPFSRFSGHGSDVADTDGGRLKECDSTERRVSIFDEESTTVSDADLRETSRRLGGVSEDSGLVFGGDNLRRGTQSYAGWQWWEFEPDVGRVAHGVPSRVDRLKGLGNAVVPQVAEVIGRLVMEHAA